MQIFNTMTRKKEDFIPQEPGVYRIYVCGPTVYNYIHIGNARPMIVFDTLRRYLEYLGNKVLYVSNITDIDDKLIKKGQENGTTMQEVARKFEAEYIKDSEGLNVKTPTVRPKTIDLHAGGQDLIFPHHENEIAQSECANGCTFSHYWMHNGFLNINNQKMSKSANNFFTVREIADKYGYEPIRYFMLTAGYRMPLNYTVDLIESCKNSLERLYTCRDNLDFAIRNAHGTDTALTEKCEEARKKFKTAMDDDLNTPDALAAIFEFVKDINTMSDAADKATLEKAAATFDELTGVLGLMYNRKAEEAPDEVKQLVEERAAAKKAKDFARADALRAKITELGWNVMDTAKGPQLTKL